MKKPHQELFKREPPQNGAEVVISTLFRYIPDLSKSKQENIRLIAENIEKILSDHEGNFLLSLELETSMEMREEVKKLSEVLDDKESGKFKYVHKQLEPFGVDPQGRMLYVANKDDEEGE
jgi:hypothetical protein